MAYNGKLAARVRSILGGYPGIEEQKMFGGLAFLHFGNMCVGIEDSGRLMVRVGKENYQKYLGLKHAKEMDFTGRPLAGFLYIEPEGIKIKAQLVKWVERCLEFTASLPKKRN